MKKLLSLLSIFVGSSSIGTTLISCNSSVSSTENDDFTISLANNVKTCSLSDSSKTSSVDIVSYTDMLSAGYVFSLESSYDDGFDNCFSVNDEIKTQGEKGRITITFNNIGTGTVNIIAEKNDIKKSFALSVSCKPDISIIDGSGSGRTPSSITISAKRGSGADGSMNYSDDQNIYIQNAKSLLDQGYTIKYNYQSTYKNSQSIFTGKSPTNTDADGYETYSGELSIDGDNVTNTSNSNFNYFKLDSNGIYFDATNIKYSGGGLISFSATLNKSGSEESSQTFSLLQKMGLVKDSDSSYEIDSDEITISSYGYSYLEENNLYDISDSSGTDGDNGGNFFNLTFKNGGEDNSSIQTGINFGTTNSVGDQATIAYLVPTDYFKGATLKQIGLSTNEITNDDLKNGTDVTIYAGPDSNSSDVSIDGLDSGQYTLSGDGKSGIKLHINSDSSLESGKNSINISVGEDQSKVETNISVGNSVESKQIISPEMDLSNITDANVSTSTIDDGSDTWSLSSTTYVNLSVLGSILDNNETFYTFYKTVDISSLTENSFNFNINVNSSADQTDALVCVLSGKFDMSMLLDTQNSNNSNEKSAYTQFMDSISSLYFAKGINK